MKTKAKEFDVRFEEAVYNCNCGNQIKEVIPVANNIGMLDTRCENCGKRIVDVQFFDEEKERV